MEADRELDDFIAKNVMLWKLSNGYDNLVYGRWWYNFNSGHKRFLHYSTPEFKSNKHNEVWEPSINLKQAWIAVEKFNKRFGEDAKNWLEHGYNSLFSSSIFALKSDELANRICQILKHALKDILSNLDSETGSEIVNEQA